MTPTSFHHYVKLYCANKIKEKFQSSTEVPPPYHADPHTVWFGLLTWSISKEEFEKWVN